MRGQPEIIRIDKNGQVSSKQQRIEELSKQIVAAEFPPGTSELMMAAAYDDIFTTKKIYQNELNRVNSIGNTALIYACQSDRMEVAKFLIQFEDIKHRNNEGYSAVDLAFHARKADMCLFLEDYCIKRGYNDLKPVARSTRSSEKQAVQRLYEQHELHAEEMFDYASAAKQQVIDQKSNQCVKCGNQYAKNAKFCTECGTKRQ